MDLGLHDKEAVERAEDAQPRARAEGAALDVQALPSFGFGHRSLMWWGTQGLMLIEGTAFALALLMWFYLRGQAQLWPPDGRPPDWLWGSLNTALMLVSLWPNQLAKQAAERLDLPGARRWTAVMTAIGVAVLGVRALEFTHLNTHWQAHAYGSIVWLILGLHTVHLITDTWDTGVLAVLLHTGPLEGRRFVDVSENALYWVFVVLSWLPVYGVLYAGPRVL
jgi:cytochrome c oxidase subunit I+III